MKKLVCMLLVLMMALSAVAMATEFVPSKTTGDLTQFTIKTENAAAPVTFAIRPVAVSEVEHAEKVEACNNEVKKLAAAENVVEYFGEVKTAAGEAINLKEILDVETVNVFEFCPFVVEDYEAEMGNVAMTMQFSTPYAVDEVVVILIGLVAEDGTVEWIAFEGIGTEEGVAVEFDAETLVAIQEGTALMAVVSR